MSKVSTVVVRFYMDRERDKRAYEFLQGKGKKEYRSQSQAIIAAVESFFSRAEQLEDDPYLETRLKEDAFLEKIERAIEQGIKAAAQDLQNGGTQDQRWQVPAGTKPEEDDEFAIAMDFIDSL